MATTYRPIGVENLEITYSSSTLSVSGTGGRALSSSNPAVVTMPSNTAGKVVSLQITANEDFIDAGGASEIIDNLFGTTVATAQTIAVPFYIYGVLNDAENTIALMISRTSTAISSPATALIGAPDDAVADTFLSFWSLENIDETLYDTNPCLSLGSFLMTKSGADDWTVTALADSDGIGEFYPYSLEIGPDANGTVVDTNTILIAQANHNDTTIMKVINATDGTDARAQVAASGGANTSAIMLYGHPSNTTTRVADRAEFQCGTATSGVNLTCNAAAGDIRNYIQNTLVANCTSAGEWTQPLQPAFLAYNSAADSGKAKGGYVTVEFDTEAFDQNSDYNNTTDTFVAPVAGQYHFDITVGINGINAATRYEAVLVTTTATWNLFRVNPTNVLASGSQVCEQSGSVLCDMNATDTAYVQVIVDGGTSTYTISGGASRGTHFSGKLAC